MFSTLDNLYTTLELGCSLTFVLLRLWHSLSDALIMLSLVVLLSVALHFDFVTPLQWFRL